MTKKQLRIIKNFDGEFLSSDDLIHIANNSEDLEEFQENAEQYISEQETIYYSNAIKFLSDYDQSLTDSIALALEMGFELESVDSELLATLLHQQYMREDLSELMKEL